MHLVFILFTRFHDIFEKTESVFQVNVNMTADGDCSIGKITLDQVASSANISKSHCINMFKRYVDESPMNYLAHFRARKCAEYLRSTEMNMEEISSVTGFGGASYMAETFRKFFGKSPREYRNEWKNPPEVQPDLSE